VQQAQVEVQALQAQVELRALQVLLEVQTLQVLLVVRVLLGRQERQQVPHQQVSHLHFQRDWPPVLPVLPVLLVHRHQIVNR
jgi:hypothetical protein